MLVDLVKKSLATLKMKNPNVSLQALSMNKDKGPDAFKDLLFWSTKLKDVLEIDSVMSVHTFTPSY